MNYWLDLFTGTTWREFRDAGATVTGFRLNQSKIARRVKSGDIFLAYLTGVMRWVGALEIIGPSKDTTRIWKDDQFPVRFEVKPIILLEPEHGVPMDELEGHVSFYASPKDKGKFRGFVRGSPKLFTNGRDGEYVFGLLKQAQERPVSRPVDPKKLARKPLYKVESKRGARKAPAIVSVPEPEESVPVPEQAKPESVESATTRHTEIQYELLALGAELGLDVWVARNDRGKK